jgi:O-antigen/teichoic acid export membrane protein
MYFLVKWRGLHGALEARLSLVLIESALLLCALVSISKKLQIHFRVLGFARDCKELLGFGVPSFVGQLGVTPVQSAFMSLLAAQPDGLNQLGLLTTANRLCSLANFLPGSMASTLIPVLASEWGKGKVETFREGTLIAIRMLWIMSLPIILLFLMLSPNLLVWLYGEGYREAWPIAFGLLLAVFLASINETADRSLAASGRIWLSTGNMFVWALLFIGVAGWLVPRYYALGYAAAYFVSFAGYVALQFWWVRRLFLTDLRSLHSLVWLSLTLVILSGLIASLSNAAVQILLAASLIAAGLLILWTKILAPSERQGLLNQFSRACGMASGYSDRAFRFLKP